MSFHINYVLELSQRGEKMDCKKNTLEIKYPERIKALRQDNDLKQRQIARILGVAQTTYSQYELYKRPMPIECLMKLCDYYKVSADYILGFTNDK